MEQSNLMLFSSSLIRLKYCSHDYELFLEGVASSNKFLIFPFFDTCVIKKQGQEDVDYGQNDSNEDKRNHLCSSLLDIILITLSRSRLNSSSIALSSLILLKVDLRLKRKSEIAMLDKNRTMIRMYRITMNNISTIIQVV